jgi:hypothetical protein
MERSRLTRYLRIAVTALSVTACVLLIALWVRSYRWTDSTMTQPQATSYRGKLIVAEMFVFEFKRPTAISSPPKYRFGIFSSSDVGHELSPINPLFTIPYWSFVLVSGALAVAPWIRWSNRFSLRTLLIATTLVAVALAAIVYAAR